MRRDARHVRANAVALVVFVGIVAVPSFYAWFNIAGSWDPYGNTGNIRVAVANEDEGYSGELVPLTVNMGERVVAELRDSDSIGYVVTSEADAVEGVRSGEYYAAVVIPADFSRDMMTTFSADPVRCRGALLPKREGKRHRHHSHGQGVVGRDGADRLRICRGGERRWRGRPQGARRRA